MALKPCRECREKVSTWATTCPKCGKQYPHASASTVLGGVGSIAILGLLIYTIASGDGQPNTATTAAPIQPINSKANITAIKEPTIACPSTESLLAVYKQVYPNEGGGADESKIALLIDHYDCKFLPSGSGIEIVSRGPIITTVAIPNFFSKATWLYVRTIDIE